MHKLLDAFKDLIAKEKSLFLLTCLRMGVVLFSSSTFLFPSSLSILQLRLIPWERMNFREHSFLFC